MLQCVCGYMCISVCMCVLIFLNNNNNNKKNNRYNYPLFSFLLRKKIKQIEEGGDLILFYSLREYKTGGAVLFAEVSGVK